MSEKTINLEALLLDRDIGNRVVSQPVWMLMAQVVLLEVYNLDGPRDNGRVVPYRRFAKMTPEKVDQWDFEKRHLMQRIARTLAAYREP